MIRTGCSTCRNWGTLKSNSPWKVDSATRKLPASRPRRSRTSARWWSALGVASEGADASDISAIAPSVASEAPPISIRWVGPQSVTSWPKRRCHMSSSGKPESANAPQAAITTPPTGPTSRRRPDGRGRRPLARQRGGQHAREQHAVEPKQDQVVRRVGERAGVAAVVDVQRDVPVHPEHGGQQRRAQQRRAAAPPRPAGRSGARRRAPRGRASRCDRCGAPRSGRAISAVATPARRGRADRLAERRAAGRLVARRLTYERHRVHVPLSLRIRRLPVDVLVPGRQTN